MSSFAQLEEERRKHEPSARNSAKVLQGPMLDDVMTHLELLLGREMALCACAESDVEVRRAQGGCNAYERVLELLSGEAPLKKRATARAEV